jgi:aromatic ring-opening dioxygenase LigB subunit
MALCFFIVISLFKCQFSVAKIYSGCAFNFGDLIKFHFYRNNVLVLSVEPSDKSIEIMRKFSEQYARKSGTYFCSDKGVTAVVIKVHSLSFICFLFD